MMYKREHFLVKLNYFGNFAIQLQKTLIPRFNAIIYITHPDISLFYFVSQQK